MSKLITFEFTDGDFIHKLNGAVSLLEGKYEAALANLFIKNTTRSRSPSPQGPQRRQRIRARTIYLSCDLMDNNYFNGKKKQVIHSFQWDGVDYTYEPNNLKFLPILTKEINSIHIKLFENSVSGNPDAQVRLNGIKGSISFYLRSSK